MLNKLDDKEIITMSAAIDKYDTKYFAMIITEAVDEGYNSLGYVLYTADKRRELHNVPREEYEGKEVFFGYGDGTQPFPQLERVVYHDD